MAEFHDRRREGRRHQPVSKPAYDPDDEVENDKAVDWLLSVRKHGLAKANEMFPGGKTFDED